MTDISMLAQAGDRGNQVGAQQDQMAALINSLNAKDFERAPKQQPAAKTAADINGDLFVLNGELPKGTADPAARSIIIVDEGAHRTHVLQMQNGKPTDVLTVPDSVGKSSTPTPIQRWTIALTDKGEADKRLDPTWYPPKNIGGQPIGPYKQNHHNPIGLAFIRLDAGKGPTGFGLHGTNRPDQIGFSVSHGCMRHNNADIMKIYPLVDKSTTVYTVRNFDGASIHLNDFKRK